MRSPRLAFVCVSLLASWAASAHDRDLGTEVLHAEDGWASSGSGVSGGSAAVPTQIYTVTNRRELIAALNNGVASSTSPSAPSNEPKIIYVSGSIDGNVDDANNPLSCDDYNRDGYTRDAFMATYDPAVWGRSAPTGPLEAARIASQAAQQARVRIRPGSNTTIVGVGEHATLRGVWLDIRGTANVFNSRSNIIVRNIVFEDTFDCFPQWSPTDGTLGSFNAAYDSVSLRDSNNVWIDHNIFRDRTTADATLPSYFGVKFQVHDGLLDITNASDLVTVSWNRFQEHDKTMLIGSSDSAVADRGKLRVTLHHNLFERIGQRAPRVRFGQVHLYDNLYDLRNTPTYQYSWGSGIESAIVAESNVFISERAIKPDRFISVLNGRRLQATDTLVLGAGVRNPVDVVAAYNATHDPDLDPTAGWVPALNYQRAPAWMAPILVALLSGTMGP